MINAIELPPCRPTDICDYLVMSTHKWMGNVKTAGVVVYSESIAPPLPHAVSFGYDKGMLCGGTAAQVRRPSCVTLCDLF